jgi:maltose alpha-D-glucosyltransferase/alpha-amylase
VVRDQDAQTLATWASYWYQWIEAVYLKSYLAHSQASGFLPKSRRDLACLLDTFVLEKALYEVDYELNHRPDWLAIPLQGILDLLGPTPTP